MLRYISRYVTGCTWFYLLYSPIIIDIPTTSSSTRPSPISTYYASTAIFSTTMVPTVGYTYRSIWPDETSFSVTALLSAVCIFLTLLAAVLIACNIKLRRQLRDTMKRHSSYAQERHTSHTNMNNFCHYDAFPKHPWQTAVFLDNSNDKCIADLW